MRSSKFIILASFGLLISCTGNSDRKEVPSHGTFELISFTQEFRELPLSLYPCQLNIDSVRQRNGDSPEFLYEGLLPYSAFAIDSNLYANLSLKLVGGCGVPHVIILQSDSNKLVDERDLIIGHCSPEPGLHCKENLFIGKDLSIRISDTVTSYTLDEEGKELEASVKRYVLLKRGRITPEGRIQLSDTTRYNLE